MIEVRPGRNINLFTSIISPTAPTIFLIHGGGGRGKQWRKQIPVLEKNYNLIIPDLLGHGLSAKPKCKKTNPYTFVEFSKDLQIIFERYATQKNILIGHSYGGPLAAYLALNNQARVNKLILIAPSNPHPKIKIPAIYRLPAPILQIIRPWLERRFRGMAYANAAPPKLIDEENAESKVNQLYVIKALLEGRMNPTQWNPAEIQTPTLILAGLADQLIPLQMITDTYGKIPNHQLYILTDCSHMLMLEKSDEANEKILNFLDEPK